MAGIKRHPSRNRLIWVYKHLKLVQIGARGSGEFDLVSVLCWVPFCVHVRSKNRSDSNDFDDTSAVRPVAFRILIQSFRGKCVPPRGPENAKLRFVVITGVRCNCIQNARAGGTKGSLGIGLHAKTRRVILSERDTKKISRNVKIWHSSWSDDEIPIFSMAADEKA